MRLRLAYSKPAQTQGQPIRERSDAEILCLLRDGDEAALDELIERKSKALLHVAQRVVNDREEAQDVVQMAFVRIWEHRERYDDRWSPNTWIYRITTNLAIDQLRSRQSRDRQREPLQFHLEQKSHGTAHRLLGDLREKEVEQIFSVLAEHLTEKQRVVFVLREIEGRSSVEVAQIVGSRESTVRNHLFNARKILQAELLRRFPEYAPVGALDRDEGGSP